VSEDLTPFFSGTPFSRVDRNNNDFPSEEKLEAFPLDKQDGIYEIRGTFGLSPGHVLGRGEKGQVMAESGQVCAP